MTAEAAARELYEGPLDPGMVMVALGNDGEPFRRDLVLGVHPFKEGMVIYEALPCPMRNRLGSGVGEIGLCPELNMRLVMRPEEAAQDRAGNSDHGATAIGSEAPEPRDASSRPDALLTAKERATEREWLTGKAWLEPAYWENAVDVGALELGALLRRALIVDATVVAAHDGSVSVVLVEFRNGRSSENWMLRLTAQPWRPGGVVARVRHA